MGDGSRRLLIALAIAALTGCGGNGMDESPGEGEGRAGGDSPSAGNGAPPDDASAHDHPPDAGTSPMDEAPEARTIGAAGGMLTVDGVSLDVPEGALESEVMIAVARMDEARVALLPAVSAAGLDGTGQLLGATFAFTPHGTNFQRPVEVEIVYEGEGNVVLRLDDERDDSWELVAEAIVQDGTARFEVDGFSIYAVAAAMRECQRAACEALSETLECGRVDDNCGGQIDLQSDCGRASCGEAESCSEDNRCVACVSTFDCATTTVECGVEVDNCGHEHDVVAECPAKNGCGANGTCTDLNLCGECTFATTTPRLTLPTLVARRCHRDEAHGNLRAAGRTRLTSLTTPGRPSRFR